MEQYFQDMIDTLRDTDIPQVRHKLAEWNDDGLLIGKCALGVLSCVHYETLTQDNVDDIAFDAILTEGLAVPFEWTDTVIFPKWELEHNSDEQQDDIVGATELNGEYKGESWKDEEDKSIPMRWTLESLIYSLNDGGLSFKQIADFLEATFEDYDEESCPALDSNGKPMVSFA